MKHAFPHCSFVILYLNCCAAHLHGFWIMKEDSDDNKPPTMHARWLCGFDELQSSAASDRLDIWLGDRLAMHLLAQKCHTEKQK